MTCTLCQKEIQQPGQAVNVPKEWGGGTCHRECWQALLVYARRLLKETKESK